jgi:hypothetical protein
VAADNALRRPNSVGVRFDGLSKSRTASRRRHCSIGFAPPVLGRLRSACPQSLLVDSMIASQRISHLASLHLQQG